MRFLVRIYTGLDVIIMKQKFFRKEGETAFRLWIFSMALAELKKQPQNAEKLNRVLEKVEEFTRSNWVKFNATDEEKKSLQTILTELQHLKN